MPSSFWQPADGFRIDLIAQEEEDSQKYKLFITRASKHLEHHPKLLKGNISQRVLDLYQSL